jgi:hypothetical protein
MRSARWIGLIGAVVYAVGFLLVSSPPGGGEVDSSDFEEFYVTDDKTALPIIGIVVLTLGVLAILWFLFSLRTSIPDTVAEFGWITAALGLAAVLVGGSLLAGPSGAQAFSDSEFVGEGVAHALAQAGYAAMLGPGSLLLGLGIAVLSYTGGRTSVLPKWVVIAGYVAAVLQLAAFIWIPHVAIPLWIVAAGLGSLRPADGQNSQLDPA